VTAINLAALTPADITAALSVATTQEKLELVGLVQRATTGGTAEVDMPNNAEASTRATFRAESEQFASEMSLDRVKEALEEWARQGLAKAVETALLANSPGVVELSADYGLALVDRWRTLRAAG